MSSGAQPVFSADTPFAPPPLTGSVPEEACGQETSLLDTQIQLSAGVELIARGLERTSPSSAVLHLQRLLRQINNHQEPADFQVFPPIRDSTSGVASKPLDYAIIGFRGELRKKPRPELMNALRVKILDLTCNQVEVDWNLAPGYDKARMVFFRDEEKVGVARLREGLEKQMKERHIDFQACTASSDMVRFHLLHKKDVGVLELRPPVIGGKQCNPRTPKYIQPNYALEIGIVGVEMFDDPEYYIGGYLEKTYHHLAKHGHAVCQQRLEMNCTVYCVVVENREIAERILEDPFPMFENCNPKPSRPQYLFHLNQHGYPTSWQRSASATNPNDQRIERKRWETFEERTNQCASTIGALAQQMKIIQDQQQQQAYQNQCAMGAMLHTMRLMNDKTQAQQDLRSLKREYLSAKRTLLFAQGQQLSPKEVEFRKQAVRDLAGELEDLEENVREAEDKASAFQAVAFPALMPASTFAPQNPGDVPMNECEPDQSPTSPHPHPPADNQAESSNQAHIMDAEEAQVAGILTSFASRTLPSQVFFFTPFSLFAFQVVIGIGKLIRQSSHFLVQLFAGWDPPSTSGGQSMAGHFSRPNTYNFFLLNLLYYYFILFIMSSMPKAQASTPFNFNALSLNLNGFANPAKISAAVNLVKRESPHVFVFQETKSSAPISQMIHLPEYLMSDAPGVSTGARHRAKWGLLVGIKRAACSIANIYVPEGLHGRVIVADLLIPSLTGAAILHRFIAIYAPWDPGQVEDASLPSFWAQVLHICQETPSAFTLMGDFNTVTSSVETSSASLQSPSLRNQPHYLSFLRQADAIDVWNNRHERSWVDSWTYKSYAEVHTHHAILDRMATSTTGVLTTYIDVLADFVPGTDHRPVLGKAVLTSPENPRHPLIPPPFPVSNFSPRYYFPRRHERHKLRDFLATVDTFMSEAWPSGAPTTFNNDDDFTHFHQTFTTILKTSAQKHFTAPSSHSSTTSAKPASATIRQILRSTHQINRLLSSLKRNKPFPTEFWVSPIMDEFAEAHLASPNLTLTSFLTSLRHLLAKCRYQEEKKVLQEQADRRHGVQLNTLLHGGSAKTFYPSSFSSLPVVLSSNHNQPFSDLITGKDNLLDHTVSYFTDLYARSPRPPQPKPWLTSPSITTLATAVDDVPFHWPKPLSIADTRYILRKGNRRPAPGPDGWEK
ncbi:hypothetical protein C0992_000002 [Termitomyces sp. T32_za158]|nr:hypothetical protein C0992_000002 [Termitomyces sp. T32_za158]